MNLMTFGNIMRPMPQVNQISTSLDVLSYAVVDCEFGKMLVARSAKGVCSILLGDSAEELAADLGKRFSQSALIQNESAVKDDITKILRCFEKPSDGLHLTLDLRGTPFQRRVWDKLQTISAGKTVSYMELARLISPFAHPRAVAGACAANPTALAIPCHRVVRGDGDLANYRWGIKRKQALIRKEAMA